MTTMQTRPVTFAQIELDDVTRDQIAAELAKMPDPSVDPERALARLHKTFAGLPMDVLQAVIDFGRLASSPGVMLVENLPVDAELPATPTDGGPALDKQTFVSECNLLGLSNLLGEPTGVTTEKAGKIVHDVIPVADGATTQTNQGSAVFLNFHNDIIYDDSRIFTISNPDFLVLMCVRGDPEGKAVTHYTDARDVTAALPPDTVAELRKPVFRLNAPGSYCRSVGADQVLALPAPLISGPEQFPEIAVSANGVVAMTRRGEAALNVLQATCRAASNQVTLRPGQALLINNRKGLHARSQFQARHDGTDRWLQRSYVRHSLWNIRYRLQPGSNRVI